MAQKVGAVLTEDTNASEDGRDGDEFDPEDGDVEIRVCGNGSRTGGVDTFIVGSSSEADAIGDAVDAVL